MRHVFPDVAFSDRLDLHLGDRHIQILHVDRAVTPGDAFDARVIVPGHGAPLRDRVLLRATLVYRVEDNRLYLVNEG